MNALWDIRQTKIFTSDFCAAVCWFEYWLVCVNICSTNLVNETLWLFNPLVSGTDMHTLVSVWDLDIVLSVICHDVICFQGKQKMTTQIKLPEYDHQRYVITITHIVFLSDKKRPVIVIIIISSHRVARATNVYFFNCYTSIDRMCIFAASIRGYIQIYNSV